MRFLLFDKDEQYIDSLQGVSYARHWEEINGEDTLTIKTRDAEVRKNFRILYQTQAGYFKEFIVKEIAEIHGYYGLEKELYCESSFYETLGDFIDDKRPQDVTATAAMIIALEPTRWQVGTVHDLGLRSTNFYRMSCKECVHRIAEVWQGEIQARVTVAGNKITGRYVDLLGQRGGDYGKRFTYTKNLANVIRTVLRDEVITALYGYGKGEFIEETGGWGRRIDFADLNEGLPYVTNEEARLTWGRNDGAGGKAHVFGKAEFDDCEDPAELLELTIARLAKISQPQVAYDCRVLDLGTVDLGDSVRVIDKEFEPELRVNARVVQIDRDLLEPERSEIVFGNYRPGITDAMNDADAYLNQFRDRAGVWDRSVAFNPDGSLDADWLNDLIAELNNRMNSQGGYVYVSDDGTGIITYDKPIDQDPTKAIQILGGAFRIANGKLPNGDWDWRTFGDGDGFIADLIVAGVLEGGKVHFNLSDGTLLIGDSPSNYGLYWDGNTLKVNTRIEADLVVLESGDGLEESITTIDSKVLNMTSSISSLNGSVSALNTSVTNIQAGQAEFVKFSDIDGSNSTTIIDGGTIKTGTISANRIDFDGAKGNNVELSGKITATSGKIGGYDISGNNLVGNDVILEPNRIKVGTSVIEGLGATAIAFKTAFMYVGNKGGVLGSGAVIKWNTDDDSSVLAESLGGSTKIYADDILLEGESVAANLSLIDFSSSLTSIDGVEGLRAYKAGHVHYLTFTYKPIQTGFITSVISGMPTAYRPGVIIAGSVASSTSSSDANKGIAAYMTSGGSVGITVGTLPGYELPFTFTWIR